MRTYKNTLMFLALGVSIGFVVWFSLSGWATRASQEKSNRPVLSKLPKIKNCAEHIKLVKAELLMLGKSQVASLELENLAYVGVISISVEQMVDKGKNSVGLSGFTPDKPPLIVIAPGERKTITLGNLGARSPIRIGAVMYSDGTEEGCESSLKDLREFKDYETRKGGPKK